MTARASLHDSAPAWFTPSQVAAHGRGVDAANTVGDATRHDSRIAVDDVVSFRCPSFLTVDYDPTHKVTRR